MSIRWDMLCLYCPLKVYCQDTLGDTCEHPKANWREVRAELVIALAELEEDQDESHI